MKTYLDRIASVRGKLDTTFPSKAFDADSQHVALGSSTRAVNLFNNIKVNTLTTNLNLELADKHIDADIDFCFPGVAYDGVVPVTINIMGVGYQVESACKHIILNSEGLKSRLLETLTVDAKKRAGVKTIELTIVRISSQRIIL